MDYRLEIIVFVILLADSIVANFIAWFGEKWYIQHFRTISKFFPMNRVWTGFYLVLVLWMGVMLYRSGALG